MKKTLDAQMRAIEETAAMLWKFAPVNVAMSKAAFYDELPEDSWRDLYCEYIGIDRAVLEQIMQMALGDLHFIMRDVEKPTTDELKEIVAEVEQMVNGLETCWTLLKDSYIAHSAQTWVSPFERESRPAIAGRFFCASWRLFFDEKIGHCLPFCLLFTILPKNGQNQNLQKSLENTRK